MQLGFSKIMDKLDAISIDHVNMKVKNLKDTLRFYNDLFGFEIKKEDNPNKSNVPSLIIGNNSIKLCLYEVPGMSPEGGIAHFGFHVSNFNEILNRSKLLGVEVLYGGTVDWEKSKSVYIKDPNGYELELSEIPGGGL